MNTRLNIALRERRGLVYTVESSMVAYGDTGMWCTYFGCDPADVNKCLRIVRRELNHFMGRDNWEWLATTAKVSHWLSARVSCTMAMSVISTSYSGK